MTDEILTVREVAELLKINEKTAYKLTAAGKIPGFKVGGSWRFERQEIANWIKRKVEEQRGGSSGDHRIPRQAIRS
ncbi:MULTISPECIES: helix-turn-helix domain-containing protein [Rhizobium]|uniref:helix-turn-helix domain-containing protein n=1 Tax=Rhizobium TaxID=379 RepID=UPI001B319464|nr:MULTISPECIES: helix-turn-helix domain-containing protein [Rhizobium]MBX4911666.1 helix-turn-helix domain-containing protein [Rhizobium bangladeshense]MBX5254449.1 helix-turn-helix domain-containing protein [Rhizobium sp. NLR4b]MBX5260594.1 helix-turn-helix domain-containing protein [Rhizobium sp. NLR16b]MBX5266719.1 helix-turn-helix domain-containing protein [Rhizobium sp. NLR16a]MBX5297126.1 helix-turn-helix domain-containing protein [Rhizobium sp. NLR15a]